MHKSFAPDGLNGRFGARTTLTLVPSAGRLPSLATMSLRRWSCDNKPVEVLANPYGFHGGLEHWLMCHQPHVLPFLREDCCTLPYANAQVSPWLPHAAWLFGTRWVLHSRWAIRGHPAESRFFWLAQDANPLADAAFLLACMVKSLDLQSVLCNSKP